MISSLDEITSNTEIIKNKINLLNKKIKKIEENQKRAELENEGNFKIIPESLIKLYFNWSNQSQADQKSKYEEELKTLRQSLASIESEAPGKILGIESQIRLLLDKDFPKDVFLIVCLLKNNLSPLQEIQIFYFCIEGLCNQKHRTKSRNLFVLNLFLLHLNSFLGLLHDCVFLE